MVMSPTATWDMTTKASAFQKDQIKTTEDIFYVCVGSSVPRTRLTSARVEETSTRVPTSITLTHGFAPASSSCSLPRQRASDSCHISKQEDDSRTKIEATAGAGSICHWRQLLPRDNTSRFSEISVASTPWHLQGHWFVSHCDHGSLG